MSNLTRRGFIVISAATLVSSCSTYTFETATKPTRLSPELITKKINEVRKAHHVKPVTYNVRLAAAARSQANLMAKRDQLSHDLGVTLRERVNKAGYRGAVGENLAGGHQTLEAAINGWLQSPGHRTTLLNTKFTEFGPAVARPNASKKSRYGIYWALMMGGEFGPWLRSG